MAILGIVSQTVWKAANKVGLYSKKQSVELATSIGKELVDISRGGGEITKDLVQTTLKKYVPRANVKIITDENSFIDDLTPLIRNPEEMLNSKASGMYYNIHNVIHGIYTKNISSLKDISILAHEIEHYLYNRHTIKRSTYKKYQQIKFLLSYHIKPFRIKLRNKYSGENIQDTVRKYFRLNELKKDGKLTKTASDSKSINELLCGEKSEEMIKSDLQKIIQKYIDPAKKRFLKKSLRVKTSIDDEIRAYSVSDRVYRYATNSQSATRSGAVVEIYKKVSEILNNNINFALNPLNWFKK